MRQGPVPHGSWALHCGRRGHRLLGREPEDLMREVETWIEAEMRRLDPEAYPAAQTVAPAAAVPRP